MNDNQSGVNTILLVFVIAALVGGAVWLYMRSSQTDEETATVELRIPSMESNTNVE